MTMMTMMTTTTMMMMMMMLMLMLILMLLLLMMMIIIIMNPIYIYISKVHGHGISKIRNPSTIPARSTVRVAANLLKVGL